MTRKEILVYQLEEVRYEFAEALDGLSDEAWTAKPIGDRNPIAWIAHHCAGNFDFFLYQTQKGVSLLGENSAYGNLGDYGSGPLNDDQLATDFSDLAAAADEVFSICIDMLSVLSEDEFHEKPPCWPQKSFESVAGNCVRVINHSNAHLRQIWTLRGALNDSSWPVQKLVKRPDDERGRFYMPPRDS